MFLCSVCRKEVDLLEVKTDCIGKRYCPSCYEEHKVKCSICEREIYVKDAETNAYKQKYYCSNCICSEMEYCDECGQLWPTNQVTEVKTTDGQTMIVCERCLEDDFYSCDRCLAVTKDRGDLIEVLAKIDLIEVLAEIGKETYEYPVIGVRRQFVCESCYEAMLENGEIELK